MSDWTTAKLKAFEKDVASQFNSGEIRYPIHLSDGNEDHLIEIFKEVKTEDWVFGSWRSHYQCLLKGVPPEELVSSIRKGHSISLCFPEYRIYSTAIVGGQLPIAVGVALSIKLKGGHEKVWCFLGDMTSETGIAQSSFAYAENHDLPITFVIEDNEVSVLTDTRKVWNSSKLRFEKFKNSKVISYKYKSSYPHAGAGVRVQF